MAEEKDAFYVVKKGDIVGVYKNLSDFQAFIGSSASNSSARVFKGYGLTKKAKKYLISHGLSNAAYSINMADVRKDLFSDLVACHFPRDTIGSTSRGITDGLVCHLCQLQRQEAEDSKLGGPNKMTYQKKTFRTITPIKKRAKYIIYPETKEVIQSTSIAADHHFNHDQYLDERIASNFIFEFQEGLGNATSNVAEYRAIILGLKQALKKGFKRIRVRADSNLVCMQIQGLCRIKSQSLAELCKEAQELKNKFTLFKIRHIPRKLNFEADAQANRAVILKDGEVKENLLFRVHGFM